MRAILCVCLLACLPAAALAQEREELGEHVQLRLVAEHAALVPGRTQLVGVSFAIAPEWHLYWVNPGDSGLPIELVVKTSPKLPLGSVSWPCPRRLLRPGGFVDFVYEQRVTALIPLNVPADLAPGTQVRLEARASWLVCKEACIPGSAQASLTLPVAAEAGARTPEAAWLDAARARLPDPQAEGPGPSLRWAERTLILSCSGAETLSFFPWLPAEQPPRDLARQCHAEGDELRVEYPAAAFKAQAIVGLLEVRRGDARGFHWIEIPPPAR